MTMQELIKAIVAKHSQTGIKLNPPASAADISHFEKTIGFSLPDDFREFYTICNGFECIENIFNMTSLEDIIDRKEYEKDWFYFAEYMINSDMWALRKTTNGYAITNTVEEELILTSSLIEFLTHFLAGNVFDKDGLYEWGDQLRANH